MYKVYITICVWLVADPPSSLVWFKQKCQIGLKSLFFLGGGHLAERLPIFKVLKVCRFVVHWEGCASGVPACLLLAGLCTETGALSSREGGVSL